MNNGTGSQEMIQLVINRIWLYQLTGSLSFFFFFRVFVLIQRCDFKVYCINLICIDSVRSRDIIG